MSSSVKRRFPSDLSDFWEIFLRRRWWFVIPPLVIAAATLGVVLELPKTYRSETTILVEPQKVPSEYVKATVTIDVNDRLQTISQEVLSRTRLQKIIDQFGLYRTTSRRERVIRSWTQGSQETQEDLIEMMRKDITLEPAETVVNQETPGRGHELAAFKIAYQGRDPALAQQVTRQLASLFIEENLRVREQQAEGTNEFIDSELEKARQALDVQEKRLREFKAQYMGALPEEQQANMQLMGQFQALLQANGDAIARAQDQKAYYQSLLTALGKHGPQQAKPFVQNTLETRRAELAVAEEKNKPDHPDVVRLRGEVAALEKLVQETSKTQDDTAPPGSLDAPDQIHSQMLVLDQEITRRNQRQTEIENKIKQVQSRVEILPAVEQQLSEITRDYTISKGQYQSLLEKKNASAMAAEMERGAKGEQFRILDPATLPEKPYKEDVVKLSLLGCFGGILCGCALGLFMEFRDKTIQNDRDMAFYLPSPRLASFPQLPTSTSNGQPPKRHRRFGRILIRKRLASVIHSGPHPDLSQVDDLAPSAHPAPEAAGAKGESIEDLLRAEVQAGDSTERSMAGSLRRAMALQPSSAPEQAPPKPAPRTFTLSSAPAKLVALQHPSASKDGEDTAFAKEQFRVLRTRLLELMRVRRIRTVMVTSCIEAEGKTLVATNLAFTMSNVRNLRVLLVDADLRKGSVGEFLKMDSRLGLSTYLLNGKGLGDVAWRVNPHLDVVPTRCVREHLVEVLNRSRMTDFLQQAAKDHDLVVIDAPPILPVADAQVLASMVDAVILVVRAGLCPYELASTAVELLQPKIIGTVLNGVTRFPHNRYYYGYYRRNEKPES